MTTTECEDNGDNNCAGRTAVNDGLASASASAFASASASASAAAPAANNKEKKDTSNNKGGKKRRKLSPVPVFAYLTQGQTEHLVKIIDKRVLQMLKDGKNSQSENAGWGLDQLDQGSKIQIQWNYTCAKQPVVVSSVKLVPVSAPPTGPPLKKRKKSVHGTKIIKQARQDPSRGWIVEYKDGDKPPTKSTVSVSTWHVPQGITYEATVQAARLVAEEEQRKQEVAAAESARLVAKEEAQEKEEKSTTNNNKRKCGSYRYVKEDKEKKDDETEFPEEEEEVDDDDDDEKNDMEEKEHNTEEEEGVAAVTVANMAATTSNHHRTGSVAAAAAGGTVAVDPTSFRRSERKKKQICHGFLIVS